MDRRREPASLAQDKITLLSAAALLRRADQLLSSLGKHGALRLAWEQVENGLKVDPAQMASDIEAFARGLPVKPGPVPSALDWFIYTLGRIGEEFTGRRPTSSTHRQTYIDDEDDIRVEHHYSGKFLELVKACAEPLGIKKNDAAWDRAISRALQRTG